jgi:predicted metal-dependent phosphoesterase TrpH
MRVIGGKKRDDLKYADLHTHTTFSDGLLSPEELIQVAYRRKYKYIGITDHDTLSGIKPARKEASKYGIEVIPGCELTAYYYNNEMHILAYFVEPGNPYLEEYLEKFRKARIERAKEIIHKLNKVGIAINFDDIIKKYKSDSIGRPHIAREIVSNGYETDIQEAFKKYLLPGKPGYVPKFMISPHDIIDIILKSGGVPVFAHPYYYFNVENIVSKLSKYGLKGLEVYHSYHSPDLVRKFKKMAKKYNLIETGGSDAHSNFNGKYLPFGKVALNHNIVTNLRRLRDHLKYGTKI